MKTETLEPTKKPYKTPVLSVYGDIRELTQAVANISLNTDGGTMSAQKTH
jgi:hypothetical protein